MGLHRPLPHQPFFVRTDSPTHYWAGVRMLVPMSETVPAGPMTLMAVSDSLRGGGLFLNYVPWLVVVAVVLLLSALIWLPLVRGITKSISQMTRTTAQIAEGRFDARVKSNRADELGRLSESINQMAARLSELVNGQRRFLGDIAHELCSPLARIQLSLGVLEQRMQAGSTDLLKDLRDEAEEMSGLVNELLSFSRASLGAAAAKLQPIKVLDVVQKAVQREVAPGGQAAVAVPADLCVLADPDLLTRALANLLRNAVRYAGAAGPLTVQAETTGEQVLIRVTDSGPGVPEIELKQIFEPFYRPDAARARETGGTGLGLAIVKTCVEACQGTVTARNRQPAGFEVEIRLLPGAELRPPDR
jgi:two-component system sensor histidine kinase CpxA